jgi:hypothetical protein
MKTRPELGAGEDARAPRVWPLAWARRPRRLHLVKGARAPHAGGDVCQQDFGPSTSCHFCAVMQMPLLLLTAPSRRRACMSCLGTHARGESICWA